MSLRPRLLLLLLLSLVSSVRAQIAADSMQNYPATAGSGIWNNGDNFGYGFEPWQFVTTGSAGIFVGDSMQNGGPPDVQGFQSQGINSPNARAWGVYGNNGGEADAVRPFATALTIGQTFSCDFDNGFIDIGGSEGIRLSDKTTGLTLWEFVFIGGQNSYSIFDARGFVATSLPFTDDGLHIDFTLTGTATYSAIIRLASGTTETVSGSLANPGDVSRFAFFDQNGGNMQVNNAYANNLSIVPEPSTWVLLLVGGTFAAAKLRRRL